MAAPSPCTARASDKGRRTGRQRAGHRGCGEDGKARDEHPLGADAVAERAGGENEGGKRNGVGVHHPLQFGNTAAERRADAVERGIDDGDVELDHAIAEAHRRKRQRRREIRTQRLASGTLRRTGPRWDGTGRNLSLRELVRIGHLHFGEPTRRDRAAFDQTLRLRSKHDCDLAAASNADVPDAETPRGRPARRFVSMAFRGAISSRRAG